ncbi:MAG: hypothetical protein Q7N95_08385 [Alphaproteobacteria bacterium]|nr:hypothetical protein [Alphaproteobacteria bacterium]
MLAAMNIRRRLIVAGVDVVLGVIGFAYRQKGNGFTAISELRAGEIGALTSLKSYGDGIK